MQISIKMLQMVTLEKQVDTKLQNNILKRLLQGELPIVVPKNSRRVSLLFLIQRQQRLFLSSCIYYSINIRWAPTK